MAIWFPAQFTYVISPMHTLLLKMM